MPKSILSRCLCFFYSWNVLLQANAQSYQDLYLLHQNLLSNYSTYMRPLLDQSKMIVIRPIFELVALVELDEIKQEVTINGLFGLTWTDELLTWNPSTYNGITYIAPDSTLIWKPRFVLLNTMSDRDLFKDDYAPLDISYDGTVSWYPGGLFPISCLLDLRKFPFDEQRCSMRLAPMYMNASDVTFDMTTSQVSRALFIPHGEWDLTDSNMAAVVFTPGNHVQYVRVDVNLTLKRKPAFFIFSVYFPVVFLCAINVLTFLIPADEGEKVGFSIAVLLSMAVYMGIVSDRLPSNSTNMPYMTHYIFLLFALSVICCVDIIFIVWLHNKEEEEENKEKHRLRMKNLASKLRIFKAFKPAGNPSDKSKIFPHSSPQHGDAENEKSPGTDNGEEHFPSHTSAAHSPNPGFCPQKIQDQLRIISAKAKLPIPEVSTTGKECSERNGADVSRNRYKNMAQKVNKYSAIVFCFISLAVTLVHLGLMVS